MTTEQEQIRRELMTMPGGESLAGPVLLDALKQSQQLLAGMADMIRLTNERMAALEKQVRMLEKVTPAQAAALNSAIRERAAAACREYRMAGLEKPVASAIRKAVRLATGARSTREIARCDYQPVRDLVDAWDEYKTMKAIKAKGAGT